MNSLTNPEIDKLDLKRKVLEYFRTDLQIHTQHEPTLAWLTCNIVKPEAIACVRDLK